MTFKQFITNILIKLKLVSPKDNFKHELIIENRTPQTPIKKVSVDYSNVKPWFNNKFEIKRGGGLQ